MNVYRIVAICMITVPVGIILGGILGFMSNREKREEDEDE